MAELFVDGITIPVDQEGYLLNLSDWNPAVAAVIASEEGIDLSPAHWEIVDAIRAFYQAYDHAPAMRPLVKYVKTQLGPEKANSIYLLRLFPGSPPKLCAKIAGLPKPPHCL